MKIMPFLKVFSLFSLILIFLSYGFAAHGQSSSLLNPSPKTSESKISSTLDLTNVGALQVSPNMIFLEVEETKPPFRGTAQADSSLTIQLDGENSTVKSDGSGKWDWTPSSDLKPTLYTLKISSGENSKSYQLKVITTLASSPTLPTTSPVVTRATPSPTATQGQSSETTQEKGLFGPLRGYLPFILGGLAIGILLFLISRLLKPKETVLSEMEPLAPPPYQPQPPGDLNSSVPTAPPTTAVSTWPTFPEQQTPPPPPSIEPTLGQSSPTPTLPPTQAPLSVANPPPTSDPEEAKNQT